MGRRTNQKRLAEGFVRPTLKEAVPGDLALCLPQKTMQSIIEMIKVLDNITPGIATEHTLLYGVEAKYYSAHPKIDNKFEVTDISLCNLDSSFYFNQPGILQDVLCIQVK